MGRGISVDELADAVMENLTEYANLATEDMKKASAARPSPSR